MKRTTIIIIALALSAFAYWGLNRQKEVSGGTDMQVDIGMVTFAGYAPLYLAKEKEFFGDVAVNLHRIEEIANIRAGISKGELEGYLATTDIAIDTDQKPLGVSVWAIDESSGGDGVVVTSDIKTVADLKGKAVAAEPGFPPYFVLCYLLNENGMSLADVQLKDMKTQDAASAFTSKSVDAAGVYEPFLSEAAKSREGSRVVLSSADTPGLIVDQIFVRDDIAAKPEIVNALITGWRKAIAFIKSNPDEANELMARAFSLPVNEFKDIASAVRWLDLDDNKALFGTSTTPGTLAPNYGKVLATLKRNRSSTFDTEATDILRPQFVESQKIKP